jgi:hypothetical protein
MEYSTRLKRTPVTRSSIRAEVGISTGARPPKVRPRKMRKSSVDAAGKISLMRRERFLRGRR